MEGQYLRQSQCCVIYHTPLHSRQSVFVVLCLLEHFERREREVHLTLMVLL
jgi:hypothetical protein